MQPRPLRTTLIGSYPPPSWLQFINQNLEQFGSADREEVFYDTLSLAVSEQIAVGLDRITLSQTSSLDPQQSVLAKLDGISHSANSTRRFGPPGIDQRRVHRIIGRLEAPEGLGLVADFQRLQKLVPGDCDLQVCIPGPVGLASRLSASKDYPNFDAILSALMPLLKDEIAGLVEAGCREIGISDPELLGRSQVEGSGRYVKIVNELLEPLDDRCRSSLQLCFGNLEGRSLFPRQYSSLFPEFLDIEVDEFHLEMANREFAELEILTMISQQRDVSVGIVDVKSCYLESVANIESRARACLQCAPANRLAFAPDDEFRYIPKALARQKTANLVNGINRVRRELEVE